MCCWTALRSVSVLRCHLAMNDRRRHGASSCAIVATRAANNTLYEEDAEERRGIARAGRGRYQDGPTAVPRSTLAPDCQGRPRSGYISSIAHVHEGRVWSV